MTGRRHTRVSAALRVLMALVLAVGCMPVAWHASATYAMARDVAGSAVQSGSHEVGPGYGVSLGAQAEDDDEALSEEEQAKIDELLDLIDKLGDPADIESSDAEAVQEALDAYEDLGDLKEYFDEEYKDWKQLLDDLADALEEAIKADEDAIAHVQELVDALPSPENVKASDADAVYGAIEAYEGLTDTQKATYDPESETWDFLEELKGALEQKLSDQEAADEVIALIEALPEPADATADDRDALDEAQDAYDALTEAQKAYVSEDLQEKLADVAKAVEADEKAKQGEGGQSGSGSSESPDPDDDKSSGASPKPDDEDLYVFALLLQWDKPDDSGEKHFVGDDDTVEDAYRSIDIEEYGETVQLNGYYLATDGEVYQTSDSNTQIGAFDLEWESSDESIATVTPAGLVTPRGKNGSVTIKATVADENVYEGTAPSTAVTINFEGQDGRYVTKVEILDDEGNGIGQDWGGVTVYNDENAFFQLHARVTWQDARTGDEWTVDTGSGEDYDTGEVGTTLTWNVSASDAFSINEDTGRLRTGAYSGNAYVTCTAVGGKGGKEVADTANVQLDTGVYEYNPSESLELKVVWEERRDEVVKEATYSYEELLDLLPSKTVNATVVNTSRFGVITAEGFLFKDVVDLVAVDDADVLQYEFATADGYDNPVSYKYLFDSGPRYYFPNYSLGGSKAEGEIVSPILAYRSAMEWGRSEANPSAELDDGNRFRLVFGCLADGDANTSFQIYYITGITIVLKGAPSAGGGGGDDEKGDDKESKSSASSDPKEDASDGSPQKGEDGDDHQDEPSGDEPDEEEPAKSDDRSDGSATGDGNRPGASNSGGGDGSGVDTSEGGWTSTGASSGESSSGQSGDVGKEQEASGGGDGGGERAEGDDIGSSKRWRVYQMMNKTNSDVPDWDDENPISPFAAPLALGTFVAGAGATGIGFRRRLK